MNSDVGPADALRALLLRGGVFCLAVIQPLVVAVPVFAQSGPRPSPAPAQGTLSRSGKFSPVSPTGTSNGSLGSPRAEAEAALKKALHLRQTSSNTFQLGQVEFDKVLRTITLPARVNIRTQIVEYALVTQQGKAYESMLTTEASPSDVHLAFLLLGVSPMALSGEYNRSMAVPETNAIAIDVSWEKDHKLVRAGLSELLSLTNERQEPQRLMSVDRWLYNGSGFQGSGFLAQQEGSVISVIRDPSALVNNPAADCDNDRIHLPNAQRLPVEGSPVRVTFSLGQPAVPIRPVPWASSTTPLSTNAY